MVWLQEKNFTMSLHLTFQIIIHKKQIVREKPNILTILLRNQNYNMGFIIII